MNTKPFFQSKIIIAAIVGLIVATLQATIGQFLPAESIANVADQILQGIEKKTLFGVVGMATSIFLIWRRNSMTDKDFVEKPFWKSTIFITAVVSLGAKIAFYKTGIELPEGLEQEAVSMIVLLATTGDILAFVSGGLEVAIAIWRTFSTTQPVKGAGVFTLKPRLTLGLPKAA